MTHLGLDQRATEKWSLAGMLSGISQDFLLEIASFSPVHANSLQNSNLNRPTRKRLGKCGGPTCERAAVEYHR